MPEQDLCAGELKEAKEIADVVFPTRDEPA